MWENEPYHPSLNFKKLDGGIYSVRIAYRWRAAAYKEGDTFVWFFIGSHASYDDLALCKAVKSIRAIESRRFDPDAALRSR